MEFSLKYTEEQERFAEEVRGWIKENIPSGLINLRDPLKKTREQWELRREIGRRLGKKGWLFAGYPREYGGGELDSDRRFVIGRELEKVGVGYPLPATIGLKEDRKPWGRSRKPFTFYGFFYGGQIGHDNDGAILSGFDVAQLVFS